MNSVLFSQARVGLAITLFFMPHFAVANTSDAIDRPNFLIIVADDMGWSDLGVTGGEIRTPNLDSLASTGTVMTQFYVAPTCSPTRAMLMTGASSHEAGLGTMHNQQTPNQLNDHRYAGQLHDGVVTMAEVLQANGYNTMMAGKWHLAVDPQQYPDQRGFGQSYMLREGGAGHFDDMQPLNPVETPHFFENGEPVSMPKGSYSTTLYTDKLIEYLDSRDRDKPFFSYLAYTAPHDPLQVPDDWLDRYRGSYDNGPIAIQAERLKRQRELGLFPQTAEVSPPLTFPPLLPSHQPPWGERSIEQQQNDARPMEIYAAMVEIVDQQIGRVLNYLVEEAELENTYVIFFSDNGASASTPLLYPGATREWLHSHDMDPKNAGRRGTATFMGREWAAASNTPYRLFKALVGDGGIRSPMIASGPNIPASGYNNSITHVMDIAPTIYDLAKIDRDNDPMFTGKVAPRGISLLPAWQNSTDGHERLFVTELFGNRTVRSGQWKITQISPPIGNNQWELYDMHNDPGETQDLAQQHPQIVADLSTAYEAYAAEVGIIPPHPPLIRDIRNFYVGECGLLCESRFTLATVLIHPATRWVVALSVVFLIGMLIRRRFRLRHS